MAQRCEQCRNVIRGRVRTSFTGRRLCDRCADRVLGAAAGRSAGGGLANARSTSGWFRRVKDFTRGKRSQG